MTSPLLSISAQEFTLGGQEFKFPVVDIQPNELLGLIGQTGSGKSILLRQMAGLIETNANVDFTGKRKAFIFARGGLFQRQTIRENLRLATLFTKLSVSAEEIDSVLYIGGGISKHIDKDFNLTTTNQNNFWQHDFRNKSWNYVGKADHLFSELINKFYKKHLIQFNENTLVITQDEVFEVDIKNNKLIIYNDINENLLFNLDQIVFDPDKDLFMLTKLNDENGSLDLFFLNRDKLLGNDTMSHKLYSSKWTFSYYLFPFVLLVFILFVVK